ncbi:MAG TPA: hypothetical protein VKR06_03910, partial [Ktedonosporobacter sp.]|nr:hypothetical protein [Ktedonosporobacter sp.]
DAHAVEGSISDPDTEQGAPVTPVPAEDLDLPQPTSIAPPSRTPRSLFQVLVVLACVLLMVAGGIAGWLFAPLPASATIAITPSSVTQTLDTTITVVAGRADATKNELAGRALPTLTFSQDTTVNATGTGRQQAASAHGLIVFYNAALVAQFLPAGTVITGASGVQVVTDEDVSIPAALLPTEGQASVTGHAVAAGLGGNIPAGDLYGPCCRTAVYVSNQAFSGGQVAREYRMVQQSDIDTAQKALQSTLGGMAQGAYSSQLASGESLVTPLSCAPKTISDKRAGDEASTVKVSMSETCSPLAYPAAALSDLAHARLDQAVTLAHGPQYAPSGSLQLDVSITSQAAGRAVLAIKASQRYHYQFTEQDTAKLAALVAGLPVEQARRKLLTVPGVDAVSISVTGWHMDVMPKDGRTISFILLN